MQAYFHEGNSVCDIIYKKGAVYAQDGLPEERNILLNITFGCSELFYNSGLGTGNYMAGFYAIRLAARTLGIDISIHCPDFEEEKRNLILPWLMGNFQADSGSTVDDYRVDDMDGNVEFRSRQRQQQEQKRRRRTETVDYNKDDVCKTIDDCPIGYMYPHIRHELRRMAVALVGIPKQEHSTSAEVKQWLLSLSPEQEENEKMMDLELPVLAVDSGGTSMRLLSSPPLYSEVELDDAILHFRCGDLMNSNHPRFGFMKFESFAKHISPSARSIGIVTQPFDENSQTRAWDRGSEKRNRCRIVVGAFVEYLQERFPEARIRLHNSPDETIALTYARLVLANQTIAGISTFGVFPAIASFGTGYIRLPDARSETNKWLLNPRLDSLVDDLVLMEEPNILMVRQVRDLWERPDGESLILEWFRNSSIVYE